MNGTYYVIILLGLIIISPLVFIFFGGSLARLGVMNTSLPEAWEKFLIKHFPLLPKLSPREQNKLKKHLKVLIAEKDFESFDELIRSDEMKIGILSFAALVALNRNHHYDLVKTIHVYPESSTPKEPINSETFHFAWDDSSGTPRPFSVWAKYHYRDYSGVLQESDFIKRSESFFQDPETLGDQQYVELKTFYQIDPKEWV
jgi:Mlc titration factor MtfA (ptsG expression regulator)